MSTHIPFTKMHGAGNDFVVVESYNVKIPSNQYPLLAVKLCDRNYGIGSDGLVIIEPSSIADYKMLFFNPDGTKDVCGNGIRCVAKRIWVRNAFELMTLQVESDVITIETINKGEIFKVLHTVKKPPQKRECMTSLGSIKGVLIDVGTPHFVVSVEDLQSLPIEILGKELEHHPKFATAVNIDFVQVQTEHHVKIRIWERSVGETLACGTAACSVAVVGIDTGIDIGLKSFLLKSPCKVTSSGGTLTVSYDQNGLFLSGPAEIVYNGVIEIDVDY